MGQGIKSCLYLVEEILLFRAMKYTWLLLLERMLAKNTCRETDYINIGECDCITVSIELHPLSPGYCPASIIILSS